MNISIYNAVSIDGFIATKENKTNWVSDLDWEVFKSKVKVAKVIVMGSNTFRSSGDDFPYDCELNIVLTHNKDLISKNKNRSGVWFTDLEPVSLVKELGAKGYDNLLIIGGGHVNASFMKAELVNNVVIDIHPILLGEGVSLFAGDPFEKKLELIEYKRQNGGLMLLTYKVFK